MGDLREQNDRESLSSYSSFNLNIEPDETIEIVSKIENYYIYSIGWSIKKSSDFAKHDSKKLYLFGFFAGILILFCIYNVINTVLYKNRIYLIICGIAISLGLYQFSFHGVLYFLDFGLNLELITALAWNTSSFAAIFLLLFAYFFFEQGKKYKKSSYITLFFIACFIALLFIITAAQFKNEELFSYAWLVALTILATTIYLFSFSIYALYKKETGAIYYFLGEGTLLVVIFFHTLGLFNIIVYNYALQFLIPSAYIVDLLSLVIALYFKNKKEQDELRKSRLLLIEQSRFNSIGQAVGYISHQWKAPLTSVGTSLTLLETIYNHEIDRLSGTFEKQLPIMKKSIELMKQSIDEFSTFYQTKNTKEDFLVKNVVVNVVDILNSKIVHKNVEIAFDIDDDFEIYGYEHIFANIFLILINNSLEAFIAPENNYIKIAISTVDKKIVITYEDNAGGIKIEPIESVFEYFTSQKTNQKGSGLGLVIAKLLVNEKLQGEIGVKNGEKGAIFTIVI